MTIQDAPRVSVLPRLSTVCTWLLASLPLLFLSTFCLAGFTVRLSYGYWPQHAVDEFSTLWFSTLTFVFCLLGLALFFLWPAVATLLLFKRDRRAIWQGLLFCVGGGAIMAFFSLVPADYLTWFID